MKANTKGKTEEIALMGFIKGSEKDPRCSPDNFINGIKLTLVIRKSNKRNNGDKNIRYWMQHKPVHNM
jgi:hypothetical protein